MERFRSKRHNLNAAANAEDLLERYYTRLLKWGVLLTRGDMSMAHDIVHDLCLHFALVKPDLSQVANLDGYLYTCLRNIYMSTLARVSREAMQFVSVAEFDSIQFVLGASSVDALLQKQNDLRRICNYAVWRKDSSKSASYFVLLFFHGYTRSEVAEIARLPIAAIYNKLKVARIEVKSHLEESGKLRIAARNRPPEPELRLSPVSSAELFNELQETILRANISECPSEDDLLAHYRVPDAKPVSCSLLSHIVSCERCLSAVDRHFRRPTLQDRRPPDDFVSSIDRRISDDAAAHDSGYKAMMRTVHRRKNLVYEHRPRTLSIAVNGKITAFHDVQSERSTLSSRVEHLESAQFVEVFTEQQVRLALLPIEEYPPVGPHTFSQRVALSDDRWLELTLNFDGLGLHSEVTYYDPALGVAMSGETAEEEASAPAFQARPEPSFTLVAPTQAHSIFARIAQYLRALSPVPAAAWAVVFACILCATGYFAYRYERAPIDANELLNRSVSMEASAAQGQTEHQTLRFEETVADGHVLRRGTIDLWRDGDNRRTVRRLYDGSHHLVTAEWSGKDGQGGSYSAPNDQTASDGDRELETSAFWKQDVSASAFRTLVGQQIEIRAVGKNYELTSRSMTDGRPHLSSAVLVLDHSLHFVSEALRLRTGSAIEEVRYVQIADERHPTSSVPDAMFSPTTQEMQEDHSLSLPGKGQHSHPEVGDANVRLAQTQIAVLYQLNKVGADIGEPIEVTRTREGLVRVSGTVANNARKQEISLGLESLPDRQLIEIHLVSQHDLRMSVPALRKMKAPETSIYNFGQTEAPAEIAVRRYFDAKGLSADRAKPAAAQFERDVLERARYALQHAYALDRLGHACSAEELQSISPAAERQWAGMLARHASAMLDELQALHGQLTQIAPANGELQSTDSGRAKIDTPEAFVLAASALLHQTQNLNLSVGNAFASDPSGKPQQSPASLVAAAANSIPLRQAAQVAGFASRLAGGEAAPNGHNNVAAKRFLGRQQ